MSLPNIILPVWGKPALLAVTAGALLVGAAWYRHSLLTQGRTEARAECAAAQQAAKDAQGAANTMATTDLIKYVETEKIVYRDRIKKVKEYVPAPNTFCPVDPEFTRLFNAPPADRSPDAKQ